MQNLIFSVLFVLALSASTFYWFKNKQPPVLAPTLQNTSIVISKLTTRRYNAQGKLDHILYASQAHSKTPNLDNIELAYPVLEVFDPTATQEILWHITAKTASLQERMYLQLNTDIILNNLRADDLLQSVHTPSLALDLHQYTVTNNAPIHLIGHTFESSGIGVKGSLKKHAFQILSHSHAIYKTQ